MTMTFDFNGQHLWPTHIEYHDSGAGIATLDMTLSNGGDHKTLGKAFKTATEEQITNLGLKVAECFGCTESYLEEPKEYADFGFKTTFDKRYGIILNGSIPI